MKQSNIRTLKGAFSLVEMLVVIAVVGIIAWYAVIQKRQIQEKIKNYDPSENVESDNQ